MNGLMNLELNSHVHVLFISVASYNPILALVIVRGVTYLKSLLIVL